MSLTVREKEHWKNRINRKIDQAVEAILAAENPNYMEKMRREANKRALESLGISKLKKEIETIDAEKASLDEKRQIVQTRILAVVRGVDAAVKERFGSHSDHFEVTAAIQRRQELTEKQVLAECDLGRRILKLKNEKDELLDTVWLATSPKQIKELWSTVCGILEHEPTQLQSEAICIEPMRT